MASTRLADHIGRVLGGRYRIAAAIGTGVSAHVFLADDVRLGRRVAVKVLHPALAGDPAFLKRFRAEARSAAALSHPHILAVYDWGEEEDGPFIVTEFLGGGSLRALLDRGHRLSASQALLIGLEAARGLDYAHRRGLVHRDIKPANLLFDDEGRLRIADFGLARALAEAAWTEPSGAVLGTARYAAPEQVRGTPLDGKSDVYSLAVVLVESVTGRVPFAADTTVGTILSRLERPLEVPDELGPMVPILSRAGQPDPAVRPDAMALGSALHALASKLPSPEPLPLVGPAMFDEVGVHHDADPTELGVATTTNGPDPAPTVPDLATTADAEPTRAIAAPAPAPAPAPAEAGGKPSKAGRRRRRWPRVVLAMVVALVCTAVAAAALVQAQIPTHALPDLGKKPVVDAERELKALGFEVNLNPQNFDNDEDEGKVVSQAPPPATKLKEGKAVTLTYSLGRQQAAVPDLGGMSREAASAALTNAGLKIGEVTTRYSETVDDDVLIDWDPKGAGTRRGDSVKLVVSDGPEPRTVPDVANLTYEQAAAKVQAFGLVVTRDERYDDEVQKDRVIGTRPGVGNKAQRGSTVVVVVSSGQPVVPNLNGMTQAQAKTALEAVDLRLGQTYGPNSGKVILTLPGAGTRVARNSSVNIYLA